ncbi:MFS transporter [Candidatus Sneabacter namystus]|uniref:AmpG family muropeptide MFS transporter n=1 Tax=Candidatus Sneabacter namystus TaxID=2601646 RepID=A0A5C0UH49_9RICK|nr:MFS transporter [Candidatus Sneabacter namystus]QEK39465.1 AmpG family muropeptide MFS transporter [Candidatus Sneabacter namystus]
MKSLSLYYAPILLGFSCGCVMPLSSSTLNFWLAQNNISLAMLGAMSFATMPYAFSFLISPYIQPLKVPLLHSILGRDKSLVVLLQLIISITIYQLSTHSPKTSLHWIFILTATLACSGAILEVVIGSIRAHILDDKLQQTMSGLHVTGYRLGMIVTGPCVAFLSNFYKWERLFGILSIMTCIFSVISVHCITIYKRNASHQDNTHTTKHNIKSLFSIILNTSPYVICFLVFYRMSNHMMVPMLNPFLLNKGFTSLEVATFGKMCGHVGSLLGSSIAAYLLGKIKLIRGLFWCGMINAIAHLGFVFIAYMPHNSTKTLTIVSLAESITGGMALAMFVATITKMCRSTEKVKQYATYESILGLARTFLPCMSGLLVLMLNWGTFFILLTSIGIASLLTIHLAKKHLC